MDEEDRHAFVAEMVVRHDATLRRFLGARLKHAVADVPDLVQEVFLRMMRVQHPETIRTPEAYLFTVAKSVLHEYRARQAATGEAVDIADVLAELEEGNETGPEAQLDAEQRLAELSRVLSQLPRKAYVTLVLNRIGGITLEEIGAQIAILIVQPLRESGGT